MASSNSYNFTVNRDNLITDALLYISAIGEGETPSAAATTEAARILNMLVKHRATAGMPAWALKRGFLLPTTEVSSVNTNEHVVVEYVTTTLSADEADAQTVLSVTDSTGMTAGDQVGIEIDDGTMHWTTIVSVDSSTQITITTAIDAAASSGSRLYSYTASTDRVQRPLRIINANILEVSGGASWEITIEERQDYFNLGNRTTEGTPNRIYYDPRLGSSTASPDDTDEWFGTIFIYPRFNSGDHVIEFTYQRPFQDFDTSTDSPDFPQEFYLSIVIELAALLGPKYGVELKERTALFAEAKFYRDEALETIYEEGSVFLQPEDENG
jgi:hypothetical protein